MGNPNFTYSEPELGRAPENGWYVHSTRSYLEPGCLPGSVRIRWDHTVGILGTHFIVVEFEGGKVVEIFEGGT